MKLASALTTKATALGMPAQLEVFREEEARPVIVTRVGIDLGTRSLASEGPGLWRMIVGLFRAT